MLWFSHSIPPNKPVQHCCICYAGRPAKSNCNLQLLQPLPCDVRYAAGQSGNLFCARKRDLGVVFGFPGELFGFEADFQSLHELPDDPPVKRVVAHGTNDEVGGSRANRRPPVGGNGRRQTVAAAKGQS